MTKNNKSWVPIAGSIVAFLFVFVGAFGMFLLKQIPYRIDYIHKANALNVYFLTLLSFTAGILTAVFALQFIRYRPVPYIKAGGWVCIFLSLAGLAVVFSDSSLGVHSVITSSNICINNTRKIDMIKAEWAQKNGVASGFQISWNDIQPYFTNGFPKCPEGGTYTLGNVGEPVRCSIPSHQQPQP
jgi:hypothetical protein